MNNQPNNPPVAEEQPLAHVLVAEDNPAVREFIVRALTSSGYRVDAAHDGHQALEMMKTDRFDVLVSDIVMPNMDGISLASKVAQKHPHTRIVMISGYAQERMRAHNLDTLVHRIISKPFSLEEISAAVKEALALPPYATNNPSLTQ